VLSLLAGTILASSAFALEPSGSAVKVTRITLADGPGGGRTLETEGSVYSGDAITTNPNGLAQIEFIDNTRIVVGPNSSLVLDEFVFNPNRTAEKVVVNAVKGVFRFISGDSPHDAYSIHLPTMVIGVRGTNFDARASGDTSYAVFHEGSGVGCPGGGACVPLDGGCRLYAAPAGGAINTPGRLETQRVFFAYFSQLLGDQSRLEPAFRANTRDCIRPDPRIFGAAPYENASSRDSPESRQVIEYEQELSIFP